MEEKKGYALKYDRQVENDLDTLDTFWKREVLMALETKLATEPTLFGVPLRRSLKSFRKLRVGDYRVIYQTVGRAVRILIVGHRSVVYDKMKKRLGLF